MLSQAGGSLATGCVDATMPCRQRYMFTNHIHTHMSRNSIKDLGLLCLYGKESEDEGEEERGLEERV